MPGQKITRAFGERLTAFGEDRIFERYLKAGGVRQLLKGMPPEVGRMSTGVFYTWLRGTPERVEKWQTVQSLMGSTLAEEGLAIVDSCDDGGVPRARLRSEYRRWLAERYNRKQFGPEQTQVSVAVIGEDFLHALKKVEEWATARRLAETSQKAQETAQEVDFEVVDNDEER